MLVQRIDAAHWMDVMPTPEEFEHNLPLLWPLYLRRRLPERAQKLLAKQKTKFERDLAVVRPAFYASLQKLEPQGRKMGEIAALYTHAWLLANSRCFYWDDPDSAGTSKGGTRKRKAGEAGLMKRKKAKEAKKRRYERDDCMALCPVLDCFNHSSTEDVCRNLKTASHHGADYLCSVKSRSTVKAIQ